MQESVKKIEDKPSQKGLKFSIFIICCWYIIFFYKFNIDISVIKDISKDFLTILGK